MSDIVPKIFGRVDDTAALVFTREERARYDQNLRNLSGKPVEVIIRKRKKPVSDQQYGYLFGVIFPIFTIELWGESDTNAIEEITIIAKMKFFYREREIRKSNGAVETERIPRSLSRARGCSMEDMCEFMSNVIKWGETDFGITFPDVNQVELPKYYHKCL